MKISTQGIKDNLFHIAGIIVGKTILKWSGLRYSKEDREQFPFSTVSANIAADGYKQKFFLFKMWR